jgi:serine/threonine-protein kinase RsbW
MRPARRTFSSDLRELAAIRAFVRDACRAAGELPDSEEWLTLLELAVTEAAANVIRHAYQGEPGHSIDLVVEAADDWIGVVLYHDGRAFDPAAVPPPSFDGSREGGFGVYLIRQAVDDVAYFQDEQGRGGVRLVKRRGPPGKRGTPC